MKDENRIQIKNIVKYIITPIANIIGLYLVILIWMEVSPYIFKFIMQWRGDGVFWSFFGRWGVLFIWVVINFFLLIPFGLIGMITGKAVGKLSPNQKFTKYSFTLSSLFIIIHVINNTINNTEFDFLGIIRLIILIIFIIILCVITYMSAIDDM